MVVLLTLLWIRIRLRLGGRLYAIIGGVLIRIPIDVLYVRIDVCISTKFVHKSLMSWLN